jgi:nucleoside-diphosphate-sugar epimerase
MKVLVTGVSGLIGGAIFNLLLEHDLSVLGICRSANSNILGKNYISLDLSKIENELDVLIDEEFDFVIHCAAYIPLDKSEQEMEKSRSENRLIDNNVISFCARTGARLIYFSTVYFYENVNLEKTEDSKISPIGGYFEQKVNSEYNIKKHLKSPIILRLSSPFGQNLNRNVVLNIFLKKAFNNEDILIHGSGERKQDFIYIKEIASIVLDLLNSDISGVFNLVSSESISMKDLAELIIKITNSKSKITFNESILGTFEYNHFSNKKLLDELDYERKFTMETAIKDLIK